MDSDDHKTPRRQDITFEDKDQALRDDVRMLGTLVGDLIREQGGDDLFEFVEREEHAHRVPWELGTLLLWDNRQVIHMASDTPPGSKSESHRIGVYDGLPFCAEEPRGRLAEVDG